LKLRNPVIERATTDTIITKKINFLLKLNEIAIFVIRIIYTNITVFEYIMPIVIL